MSRKILIISVVFVSLLTCAGAFTFFKFFSATEEEAVCPGYPTQSQEQEHLMYLLGEAPVPDAFAKKNTPVSRGVFYQYQWHGGKREEWGQSEWIETEPLLESTYTSIAFDDYDDDGCLDALALINANPGGNTMITTGIALYHYDSDKETLELADYYPFGNEMNVEVKVPFRYFDVASQKNESISVLFPYPDPAAMENVSAAVESGLPIEYAIRGTYSYGEGKIVLKKAEQEKAPPALAQAVDNYHYKR